MEIEITGVVIRGKQLGRTLGFPTANIRIDNDLPVKNGVYVVRVNVQGIAYKGVASVGGKPTVSDSCDRTLEVYIFDFSASIYGERITVVLLEFIRGIEKFSSIEQLTQHIHQDEKSALAYFEAQATKDNKE